MIFICNSLMLELFLSFGYAINFLLISKVFFFLSTPVLKDR